MANYMKNILQNWTFQIRLKNGNNPELPLNAREFLALSLVNSLKDQIVFNLSQWWVTRFFYYVNGDRIHRRVPQEKQISSPYNDSNNPNNIVTFINLKCLLNTYDRPGPVLGIRAIQPITTDKNIFSHKVHIIFYTMHLGVFHAMNSQKHLYNKQAHESKGIQQ